MEAGFCLFWNTGSPYLTGGLILRTTNKFVYHFVAWKEFDEKLEILNETLAKHR